MTATICLTMIVKDEAHIIARCLKSVRPFIDTWLIVDTGSSDGTQSIIRDAMKEVPGELLERPWINFGHNRTEAIELASERADYMFMIDADEELALPNDFSMPALKSDAYSITVDYQGTSYGRTCLLSTKLRWRYVGVLHEYPAASSEFKQATLEGPRICSYSMEGGRSKGIDECEKYARDARILEKALRDEPNNDRYVFYLAQSYRDAGQLRKSLDAYQRRSRMGGWDEEIWYSLYQVAKLSERLELAPEIVIDRYLQAYQTRFTRAEPLVDLARIFRSRKQYVLAHLFAERAIKTPRPVDILFIDDATYAWRAIDEYAIASYWVGNYRDSARACEQLLNSAALPMNQLGRVTENLNFALKALGENPRPPSVLSTTQKAS